MEFDKSGVSPGDAERQVIYIATLGLEERSQQVLVNALNKYANGLCVLTDAQQAQIALIDLESKESKKLLNEFHKNFPSVKLVGLGKQQDGLPVQAFIAKPVKLDLLLSTIVELTNYGLKMAKNVITNDKVARAMQALDSKNIAKSLHQRAEKNQPKTAAQRAMPGKTDEVCFDPERFLLGAVLTAVTQASNNNQTAALTCWNDRTIFIDPAEGKIVTNLSDNQIRSLAIAPVDDNLSSPIHTEFYPSGQVSRVLGAVLGAKDMRHFPQEVFLWNLGLLTCRGRIPSEITVCDRYYLRRWPNLTRVSVSANAMRILAFWNQQPCSLTDIKEQLDIPYQDIFNVVSAAYAAGLTGEAKRKSDQIMHVVGVNEHNKRGLMNSIISRLRSNKTEQYPRSA